MAEAGEKPQVPPSRIDAVVTLLERRASLLQPDPDLIARALRRCRRFEVRSQISVSAIDAITVKTGPIELDNEPLVSNSVAAAATQAESVMPPALPQGQRIPGSPFRVGDEIAGYRIFDRLGKGGMGDVFRAEQLSMGREVAFKVLAKRLAHDEAFRNRFIREARSAGRLQHPNLIAVHDVGEAEKLLFFSMELVRGKSVGDHLDDDGSYDEKTALGVIRQVLEALRFAHAHGLVHRDIKPDNIMVTTAGVVKVADLGLARETEPGQLDGVKSDTQSGAMMGTPSYMAPEQGQDAHSVDHRADIYSTGATLYHMVFGEMPFKGRTAVEVVVNATTKPLTFPDGPGSTGLRKLIAKMMAKDPSDRMADCDECMVAVDRLLGSRQAARVGPSGRFVERSSRRGRMTGLTRYWVIGLVVLAVLLASTVTLLQYLQQQRTWDEFSASVDQAVEDSRYVEAVAIIDAFSNEHPGLRGRSNERLRATIAAWDQWALAEVNERYKEFDYNLRIRNYRDAQHDLELIVADATKGSPAVLDKLDEWQGMLQRQQDLALANLEADVEESIAESRFLQAHQHLEDFGLPTIDRLGAFQAIEARLMSAWDHAGQAKLSSDLHTIERMIRAGQGQQALAVIKKIQVEKVRWVSPAVSVQLDHYAEVAQRSGANRTSVGIDAWLASASSGRRHRGEVPTTDNGRVIFEGQGDVFFPRTELLNKSTMTFVTTIEGDVDWRLIFGSGNRAVAVHVERGKISLKEGTMLALYREGQKARTGLGPLAQRREAQLDQRGGEARLIKEAQHAGSARIVLKWSGDTVTVDVGGLDVRPVPVPIAAYVPPMRVMWNNRGKITMQGKVVSE